MLLDLEESRGFDKVKISAVNRRGREVVARVVCSSLRGNGGEPGGAFLVIELRTDQAWLSAAGGGFGVAEVAPSAAACGQVDPRPDRVRKVLVHPSSFPPRQVEIGDAAAFVGTTPRAIRHYHDIGLLPEPDDTAAVDDPRWLRWPPSGTPSKTP